MDLRTLSASIDLAIESPSNEVRLLFLGGEPLLAWPLILDAVEYTNRHAPIGKKISFELSTNGFLLTDEFAEFLEKHRFEIQLSFDGIEAAQNYRRRESSDVIVSLLERIKRRQKHLFTECLCVSVTLIPETICYLADSIQFLMDKGITRIAVNPSLIPPFRWSIEDIRELDAQFLKVYNASVLHFEKSEHVPLMLFRKGIGARRQSSPKGAMCDAVLGNTIVVDVDGQVYGCVTFAESYQEFPSEFLKARLAHLRMGSLHDPKFRERRAGYPTAARGIDIFHEKEKKYSSYGKCSDCPYIDRCSVCPVSIGYDPSNADPHRIPDFICAFNRTSLKYGDLFPCMPDPLEKIKALFGIASSSPDGQLSSRSLGGGRAAAAFIGRGAHVPKLD